MLRRALPTLAVMTLAVLLIAGCGSKEETENTPAPSGGQNQKAGGAPTATTTIPLNK